MRFTVPRQPAWKTPTARRFDVHEYDRQAVRGQNCEQQTRGLRDQAVAGETRLGNFRNAMNKVGMNLAKGNQRPLAPLVDRSELAGETRPGSVSLPAADPRG